MQNYQSQRLNKEERRNYKLKHPLFCHISGQEIQDWFYLEIHHIIPVIAGGKKDFNNLVLLEREVHRKVHQLARDLSTDGSDEAEIVENLTKTCMELTALSLIDMGYDPKYVYGRIMHIDKNEWDRVKDASNYKEQ